MDERRAQYRVTSRGMRVTLAHAEQRWTGSVGDTTSAGASVVFPLDEAPALPLGARMELTFSGGPLPEPISVGAVLKARTEGDFRRYGFAFDAPGRFRGSPSVWGTFNRREWVRLAPDRPVLARISAVDGPEVALEGRLVDVSHGGIAVVLGVDAERILGGTLRVRCTFRPAGASADETRTCDIRNRQIVQDGDAHVRYGMAFVRDGDEPELSLPVYEPCWDCGRCGTSRLLAHTHQVCPMCGARPAHERTYLPPWDEAVSADRHVLTGADRRCACGATWSALARCCGRCGERLP